MQSIDKRIIDKVQYLVIIKKLYLTEKEKRNWLDLVENLFIMGLVVEWG